ncbi:FeoC-like transcriptional regulator [Streptomyces celluloflavus]|uniref:FeoC-like transcriptional regulator n=1 Tax=Streptomyces celluloflavus TaxID=58344 RepID=UPI00367CB213
MVSFRGPRRAGERTEEGAGSGGDGRGAAAGVAPGGAVSPLRRVLVEMRRARGGARLEDIAARVGVGPDEVASMVEYWVGRGLLTREAVSGGCPESGCGGCAGWTSCGARDGRAGGTLLHTIRVVSPPVT